MLWTHWSAGDRDATDQCNEVPYCWENSFINSCCRLCSLISGIYPHEGSGFGPRWGLTYPRPSVPILPPNPGYATGVHCVPNYYGGALMMLCTKFVYLVSGACQKTVTIRFETKQTRLMRRDSWIHNYCIPLTTVQFADGRAGHWRNYMCSQVEHKSLLSRYIAFRRYTTGWVLKSSPPPEVFWHFS